jgi:hypothetical protein
MFFVSLMFSIIASFHSNLTTRRGSSDRNSSGNTFPQLLHSVADVQNMPQYWQLPHTRHLMASFSKSTEHQTHCVVAHTFGTTVMCLISTVSFINTFFNGLPLKRRFRFLRLGLGAATVFPA